MSECMNHPGVPATGACARCGQPYCDSCLVEFLGARYCGPCRNLRLAETQGFQPAQQTPVFAGTGNVDIGRWLTAGWQMVSADLGTWMLAALVAALLAMVTCGLGLWPMSCGIYLLAFRKLSGRPITATDVTLGFRRFANALGTGILLALPSIVLYGIEQGVSMALQFGIRGSGSQPNFGAIGLLLFVTLGLNLISYAVSFVTYTVGFFSLAHVAARNVGPIDAIRDSWTVVKRNFWMFLLTAVLFQVIAGLGALALCIGVLVTGPLVAAATAQAYADHFGLEYAQLD